MNKMTYTLIRLSNYFFLGALLVPITASAAILEQVEAGNRPIVVATGACSGASDIDHITRNVVQAKRDLRKSNSSGAEKSLKYAYKELQNIQQSNNGKVVEHITVTHGPKIDQSGFINTANAYYSPTMRDMRLLRMAEDNLKSGKSHAACDELSVVRFPYVSASELLTVNKAKSEVHHALTDLQSHKLNHAMADIKKYAVTTGTYASIFQQ